MPQLFPILDYINFLSKPTFFNRIFQTFPIRNMENSTILNGLLDRLAKAEQDIKLLNVEVRSIRKEIIKVKIGLAQEETSVLKTTTNKIRDSTKSQRGTILIPTLTKCEVDGPPSKRHKIDNDDSNDDDDDEIDNSKVEFTKEDNFVVAYTDGACENNGKPNAKAGIGVWFGDNHPLNISKPVDGRATNNTAEIQACVECLKVLQKQGVQYVKIHTDSQFTINCMKSWIHNWKKNNWKTANGQPVKNKEDLVKLDLTMKEFSKVEWVHVAGHRGIRGNEEADRLARRGALHYKKNV